MSHRHVPYTVPDRPTASTSSHPYSPSDSTNSSSATAPPPPPSATTDPVFLEPPTKLQQTTDKSCVVCRERRVRCSREWPRCTRCVKRREECVYGEGITVETKETALVDPRVKQLEAKLATLESQLASNSASPPLNLPLLSNAGTSTPVLANSIQAAFPPLSDLESSTLLHYLVGQAVGQQRLGQRESLDWRLARPRMGELLTLHLLDAAQEACCARLPSLKPLMSRIPFLQSSLHSLNPSNQAAVSILAALGARSSSHSAVLGLAIPGLADGTADPKVYLTVGSRREKACRALYERAAEVCWLGGVLSETLTEGLETLVGLAQVMIFEEIRPKKSRFYLRNAVGMYSDMQADPHLSPADKLELRKTVGNALYLDDAIHSAQLSKHPLIPTEELPYYFSSTGLSVPDFNNQHLHELLEETLLPPAHAQQRGSGSGAGAGGGAAGASAGNEMPVTMEQLEKALDITGIWVCYLQRTFARLTTARRPSAPSILTSLQTLWTQIDVVHSSVQRLQNYFVNLQHSAQPPPQHYTSNTPTPNFGLGTGKSDTPDTPSNLPKGAGDPWTSDHFVLLAVRADTRLVDLVNLIHEFLRREDVVSIWGQGQGDERDQWQVVERLREESEMRVRKCLKLVAFYSRLYLSSMDKHVVHHLTMQLELLPSWTKLAVQTVGQPGGPSSSEFEVSNEELDWLLSALRLALFYTPKAATRLQELTEGKAKRSNTSSVGTPSLSHSRVASPPSPDFPHGSLPGAPSFPHLGASDSRNGGGAGTSSHSGGTSNGLTRAPDDYFNSQDSAQVLGLDLGQPQYQFRPPTPSPHHQKYQQHREYPAAAPQQHQQRYSLPPFSLSIPDFLPTNPTPPSSSVPGVNSHLQLPANSPSLHASTPYSPYRPSSTSLPSTNYPSQWAFNAYGFPSISPQYEKQDPFALGQGEMENWVEGGASWTVGAGGGGMGMGLTGMGGGEWENQQQGQSFDGQHHQTQWAQQQDGGGGGGGADGAKQWNHQRQQETPGVDGNGLW